MKARETLKRLRDLDERELNERYQELARELFNLRFQAATAQLSSPARFKQVRREIAQIRTVAHERDMKVG